MNQANWTHGFSLSLFLFISIFLCLFFQSLLSPTLLNNIHSQPKLFFSVSIGIIFVLQGGMYIWQKTYSRKLDIVYYAFWREQAYFQPVSCFALLFSLRLESPKRRRKSFLNSERKIESREYTYRNFFRFTSTNKPSKIINYLYLNVIIQ